MPQAVIFSLKVWQIFIAYESVEDRNLRAVFSRVKNALSCSIFLPNSTLTGTSYISQPASKLFYLGQAKRASRERATKRPRKGELATISHKFSFPPRKLRDSAKRENVTTACQVSLDSRGHVELFIFKSLSPQHQSNQFLISDMFIFSTGTSNFNVSARITNHYFDSRFVYF